MGTKEKLMARLLQRPKDFSFEEAEVLLAHLGFRRSNKGRTSGSRVAFSSDTHGVITLHRPHPSSVLKSYQVGQLIDFLKREGLV